jgi:hypothetical protein
LHQLSELVNEIERKGRSIPQADKEAILVKIKGILEQSTHPTPLQPEEVEQSAEVDKSNN